MSTGHIKTRTGKDGKISYQLVVEVEADPVTGKRNRYYRTVKGTKKQVQEALRKFQNEIDSGYTTSPSTMKVSDWMDQWLTQYRVNIEDTTRSGYKDKIKNQINPHLGALQIKALTASVVQKWVNTLHKDRSLSPKTIRNAFLILHAAMKKAVITKMITSNPCEGVELPKSQKYMAQIYTTQEITQLLELAKDTDMYIPLLLVCCVGFRRGELLALKWHHIDFNKGIIHIQSNTVIAEGEVKTKAPKSAAGIRHVTIGANVLSALKMARAQYNSNKLFLGAEFTDSGLVVCQPNGKPFRPESMTQKWERFVEKHNLKKIRFHDLRHSCTTMMIEAGVDLKTVQTRMGHANISTTMNIYAHCTAAMDQKAADKLDDILFA